MTVADERWLPPGVGFDADQVDEKPFANNSVDSQDLSQRRGTFDGKA
jgi:hypothetical protein